MVLDGEVRVMQVPTYVVVVVVVVVVVMQVPTSVSKGLFLSSPYTTVLGLASSQSYERASRVARVTILLAYSGA